MLRERAACASALALCLVAMVPVRAAAFFFYGTSTGQVFSCDVPPRESRAHALVPTDIMLDGGYLSQGYVANAYPYGLEGILRNRRIDSGKWAYAQMAGANTVSLDPDKTKLEGRYGKFPDGELADISLFGEGLLLHRDTKGDIVKSCSVKWSFVGQQKQSPPSPPPRGTWKGGNTNPLKFKSGFAGTGSPEPGQPDRPDAPLVLGVSITPCAQGALCFGRPGTGRADLVVRTLKSSTGRLQPAYLSLDSGGVEFWSKSGAEADANARAWSIVPSRATSSLRPGFVDTVGYGATAPGLPQRTGPSADEDGSGRAAGAPPPPPSKTWLTTPTQPGFGFQALLGTTRLVKALSCPNQAFCFARRAGGPPEVVVRILPKAANGLRWSVLGKFADQPAKVWVKRFSGNAMRYYSLPARDSLSSGLPGIVDRRAFRP